MLSTPHGFHGKSTFMSRHTPFSPICHTPILPIYHRHLCMTHPVFPICHTLFFLYITPHMTQPVFSPYVTPHPSYISRTLIYETARFPHMSHTPSCLYVTAPYNHHTYSPPPPPPAGRYRQLGSSCQRWTASGCRSISRGASTSECTALSLASRRRRRARSMASGSSKSGDVRTTPNRPPSRPSLRTTQV